jgi:hypothetical protein
MMGRVTEVNGLVGVWLRMVACRGSVPPNLLLQLIFKTAYATESLPKKSK